MKACADPETIRQLLEYDPDTGVLTWRPRHVERFPSARTCKIWNSRFAGKEAGAISNFGYRRVCVDYRLYVAQRLAWVIAYGFWPVAEIDHINGDRADNRVVNLRLVSHTDNARNTKMGVANTSGHIGVHLFKRTGRWTAAIGVNGERVHLGYFATFDAAVVARKAAERQHGFHPNHGRR